MADEEKIIAEAAAETPESTEGGKKKLPFTPLMILVYVSIVFAASALTELVIVPQVSQMLADKGMVQQEVEEELAVPDLGEIYVIEDLVVNPAGSGGTRYVAASIGLEAASSITSEIERRDPQIKDALIQILSSRTIEELADVAQRESVRKEIQNRVEEIVPQGGIDAVYFVSFVLQ